MKTDDRRGMALVAVLCLTVIAAAALAILGPMVGGARLRSQDALHNEQAFYVAEGAVELAVQHIADGGTVPATLTGTLGWGTYRADVSIEGVPAGGYTRYRVVTTGTVGRRTRRVAIQGVRAVSWARYALWYNDEALQLWIVGGEQFRGPVHANTQLHFHSHQVATLGQAHFFEQLSSTESSYELYDANVNPTFDMGVVLDAPEQSTSAIDFTQLRADADRVFDGTTRIRLAGANMVVSNARAGLNNVTIPFPTEGSVYVRTVTTGTESTKPGDVIVDGSAGMSGRLTIIAERDVQIVNHVRYADNPISNPSSTDALGLVAQRHVMVQTSAPNNLEVFAHIMAADGGFGVVNYNSSSLGNRGQLTVYGGIVNHTRQAVGTTGGTGYRKNYQYDSRFHTRPPPGYPVLPYAYQWTKWEDG